MAEEIVAEILHFMEEAKLDFALIALGPMQSGDATIANPGFCPLSDACHLFRRSVDAVNRNDD